MKITRTITEEVSYTVRKIDRSNIEPKLFARTDIIILQWSGACNVFVEVNGKYQTDLWDKSVQVDKEEIANTVKKVLTENSDFVAEQKKHIDRHFQQINKKP